ncbi:rhamnulokinase [Photobacterium damselae]|uniref:rhamnulokinase n=1 Tax=Photobacterium damselae TaxID=38293 RepID=UPI001EFDEA41|nr:rhamnulokinase [Photobacterium damselae]MCG9778090.1 rhamnulokinase [Photobacterium damselae]
MGNVIAIDLGASSGRVMVGTLENSKVSLKEYHRFLNKQVIRDGQSCWDLYAILEEIERGISKVVASGIEVDSLGIDTWGVDFVLLDKFGKHLGNFVSYRDTRTGGALEKLVSDTSLTKEVIYTKTGIQFLSFNSIYQLKAICDAKPEWIERVDKLLFIPDYLNYKLCGTKHCEYTNASTSQLLNCQTKEWDEELIRACGAKEDWFLEPTFPNNIVGRFTRNYCDIPVVSIASHDTASAVTAAPVDNYTAYLSSGTWSLLGIESFEPYTSEQAYHYNITNEGGVEGRYRVLKNIMGLWLMQRLRAETPSLAFSDMALMAKDATPFKYIINPNDGAFLNPASMTAAIKNWFKERDLESPQTFSEVIRCVYDSLALAYSNALENIKEVSTREVNFIRIVGGGAQDKLLNQLCADVCETPVIIEPVEASALGNVANQMIALGKVSNIEEARKIIQASCSIKRYNPNPIEDLNEIKSNYKKIL